MEKREENLKPGPPKQYPLKLHPTPITKELWDSLRKFSRKKKLSVAEIIRQALTEYIGA